MILDHYDRDKNTTTVINEVGQEKIHILHIYFLKIKLLMTSKNLFLIIIIIIFIITLFYLKKSL